MYIVVHWLKKVIALLIWFCLAEIGWELAAVQESFTTIHRDRLHRGRFSPGQTVASPLCTQLESHVQML